MAGDIRACKMSHKVANTGKVKRSCLDFIKEGFPPRAPGKEPGTA